MAPVKSITPEEGLGMEGDAVFSSNAGIQEFSYVEEKALKNKRYTYYIVRVERNGTESNKSATLSKRVAQQ